MNSVSTVAARAPTPIEVRPKPQESAPQGEQPERTFWQRVFGDDGLTFSTLLDVVNPLQHIPVVSTIYREITGDRIAPGAKLIGDTLFGGPIGLALSAVDVTVRGVTDKDIGEHVLAAFKPSPAATDTAIASADTAPMPPANPASAPEHANTVKPEAKDAPQIAAATSPVPTVATVAEASNSTDTKKDTKKQVATVAPPANPTSVPRSAFVTAAMRPRNAANGVGGAFVALETRSTIAPQSMFTPVSLAAPAEPMTSRPKQKVVAVPDAKTVAGSPDMLRSLRTNGARPASAPAPHPGPGPALPALDTSGDAGGSPSEYGDIMARNLERYMALRNRRPAPTKIDRAF